VRLHTVRQLNASSTLHRISNEYAKGIEQKINKERKKTKKKQSNRNSNVLKFDKDTDPNKVGLCFSCYFLISNSNIFKYANIPCEHATRLI